VHVPTQLHTLSHSWSVHRHPSHPVNPPPWHQQHQTRGLTAAASAWLQRREAEAISGDRPSRNPALIICTDMAVGIAHSKQPGRRAAPQCPAAKRQLGAQLTGPGSHGGGRRAATASRRPPRDAQRHHLQLLLQEAGAQVWRRRSGLRSARAPCTRSELYAPLQSIHHWPCRP
jgi:hypothetical protein